METCSLCQGFVPNNTTQCPNCDTPLCRPKKGLVKTLLGAISGGALSITLMACYGAPPAICGDGQAEPWKGWGGNVEECDDANTISGDGCSGTCQLEVGCGNGILAMPAGEACDDDNIFDGDGCSSFCTKEPGFLCTEESPSVCTTICGDGILIEMIVSGNEFIRTAEECDDGNLVDGDGCTAECRNERCGDGLVNNAEECDDGVNNSETTPGACRTDCSLPACGDLVMDPGEECDNGILNGTDSQFNTNDCRADCTLPRCGDAVLDEGEQCDDGNQDDTDTCSSSCQPAVCGDGLTQTGVEECDDGNQTNTDACTNICKNAVCGDDFMRHDLAPQDPAYEQCDDGNQDDTDDCKSDCTLNL